MNSGRWKTPGPWPTCRPSAPAAYQPRANNRPGWHGGTEKTARASRAIPVEVAGLFALGVGLILVGFWFGLPHKRLSDLPPEIVVVSGANDRSSVFNAVAGSYVTGKKPGDSIVTITPQGRVSLGSIGKDGKPGAPRLEEQARAARKGNLAVVVTSFGLIAEFPPDAVNVGSFKWRKVMN